MNDVVQGSVTATTETAAPQAEAAAQTEAPKDNFTDKFARLAQLDKAQRARDAEIKAKMKDLESREMTMKEKIELADLIEKDPLAVLKRKNIDLHKLYSDGLNAQEIEDDPVRKELAELKAWKEDFENKQTKEKTVAEQREEAELSEKKSGYLNHLDKFVKSNEEKFPLLASFQDASEKIYEVIATVYDETGKVITPEEASAHLQNELVEGYKLVLNKKGVLDLFNLNQNSSDNTFESFLAPESGSQTLDQTFSSATTDNSTPLSTEEERMRAATRLAEQIFKSQKDF